jgi:signal transduction histidine kinase
MATPQRELSLLLVEDDPDDYVLTRDLLGEMEGVRVELSWTPDYEEGLQRARSDRFDVVLVDYLLGERTGLDLLRELGGHESPVPVILLTGQGDHEIDLQAMRAGASDYLVKGRIDASLLERAVRYALERKRAERERAALLSSEHHAREQAEAAVRARDEVLRIVSHDLGNSLSAVAVHARLLSRALPPGAEDAARRVGAIQHLVKQMHRLRQDLMDVSQLEAGRMSMDLVLEEPEAIAREAEELMAEVAEQHSVTLSCSAEPHLPLVRADRERVLQVLGNLVGNAIKFTSEGGSVALELAAEGTDEVRFSVRDTGPGIPPEHQPHLFDRFWQAQSTRRAGAGLGLAIAKGIVEAHGGRIWVESVPTRGSVFSFTLAAAR